MSIQVTLRVSALVYGHGFVESHFEYAYECPSEYRYGCTSLLSRVESTVQSIVIRHLELIGAMAHLLIGLWEWDKQQRNLE